VLLSHLVFDLDQTIYPRGSGLMQAIGERIMLYMTDVMGLEPETVPELRHRYWRQYGTTSRGLAVHHELDVEHYMDYVHDLPLEAYLRPDPDLDAMLSELPQRKVIFTNATASHAHGVLRVMGLERHFDGVYDVFFCENEGKPALSAYRRLLTTLEVSAKRCLMVEDSIVNLLPAGELGMVTVLVDPPEGEDVDRIDYVISRVADVGRIVRSLNGRGHERG
jgi:putative hydrolase of the HAD superfamily